MFQEQSEKIVITFLRAQVDGSVANVIHGVDVRPSHEKKVDTVSVLLVSRIVKWPQSLSNGLVHFGSAGQENSDVVEWGISRGREKGDTRHTAVSDQLISDKFKDAVKNDREHSTRRTE